MGFSRTRHGICCNGVQQSGAQRSAPIRSAPPIIGRALKQNYEKPPPKKETEQWKVEHRPLSPREIPGLSSPSTPRQCLRGGRQDAPTGRKHRLAKGRPKLPGQKFGKRWAQTGRVVVEERSVREAREVVSKSRRAKLAAERERKKRRKERRREEKLDKDKEDGQSLFDVKPTEGGGTEVEDGVRQSKGGPGGYTQAKASSGKKGGVKQGQKRQAAGSGGNEAAESGGRARRKSRDGTDGGEGKSMRAETEETAAEKEAQGESETEGGGRGDPDGKERTEAQAEGGLTKTGGGGGTQLPREGEKEEARRGGDEDGGRRRVTDCGRSSAADSGAGAAEAGKGSAADAGTGRKTERKTNGGDREEGMGANNSRPDGSSSRRRRKRKAADGSISASGATQHRRPQPTLDKTAEVGGRGKESEGGEGSQRGQTAGDCGNMEGILCTRRTCTACAAERKRQSHLARALKKKTRDERRRRVRRQKRVERKERDRVARNSALLRLQKRFRACGARARLERITTLLAKFRTGNEVAASKHRRKMNRHVKRAQRGEIREQQVSLQADGRFGGDAHGSAGVPVGGAGCVPAASNRPQREGVRPSEPEKCTPKEKRDGPLYEISRFRKRMRSKKDDEQEGGSDSDLPPLINGYDTDEEGEDRDSSDPFPSDSTVGCTPGLLDPSRRGSRVMGSPREASPMVPGGNGRSGAAEPITSQVPDQREYGLLAQEDAPRSRSWDDEQEVTRGRAAWHHHQGDVLPSPPLGLPPLRHSRRIRRTRSLQQPQGPSGTPSASGRTGPVQREPSFARSEQRHREQQSGGPGLRAVDHACGGSDHAEGLNCTISVEITVRGKRHQIPFPRDASVSEIREALLALVDPRERPHSWFVAPGGITLCKNDTKPLKLKPLPEAITVELRHLVRGGYPRPNAGEGEASGSGRYADRQGVSGEKPSGATSERRAGRGGCVQRSWAGGETRADVLSADQECEQDEKLRIAVRGTPGKRRGSVDGESVISPKSRQELKRFTSWNGQLIRKNGAEEARAVGLQRGVPGQDNPAGCLKVLGKARTDAAGGLPHIPEAPTPMEIDGLPTAKSSARNGEPRALSEVEDTLSQEVSELSISGETVRRRVEPHRRLVRLSSPGPSESDQSSGQRGSRGTTEAKEAAGTTSATRAGSNGWGKMAHRAQMGQTGGKTYAEVVASDAKTEVCYLCESGRAPLRACESNGCARRWHATCTRTLADALGSQHPFPLAVTWAGLCPVCEQLCTARACRDAARKGKAIDQTVSGGACHVAGRRASGGGESAGVSAAGRRGAPDAATRDWAGAESGTVPSGAPTEPTVGGQPWPSPLLPRDGAGPSPVAQDPVPTKSDCNGTPSAVQDAQLSQGLEELHLVNEHAQVRAPRGASLPPVGLPNLGNTCYINAVLQCLLVLGSFHRFVGQQPVGHVLVAFRTMCRQLSRAAATSDWELAGRVMTELVPAVQRAFPDFRPNQQQDAQEFFSKFVANLWLEVNVLSENRHVPLIDNDFLVRTTRFTFSDVCGNTSDEVKEVSSLIHVPLPTGLYVADDTVRLEDCLIRECRSERLTDRTCHTCHANHAFERVMLYEDLPTCLVVHVARFHTDPLGSHKLHTNVSYPMDLDLSGCVVGARTARYKLRGAVFHKGASVTSGHYFSHVEKGGRGYECDDDRVSELPRYMAADRRESREVYTLFYEKQAGELPILSTALQSLARQVQEGATITNHKVLENLAGPSAGQLPRSKGQEKRLSGKRAGVQSLGGRRAEPAASEDGVAPAASGEEGLQATARPPDVNPRESDCQAAQEVAGCDGREGGTEEAVVGVRHSVGEGTGVTEQHALDAGVSMADLATGAPPSERGVGDPVEEQPQDSAESQGTDNSAADFSGEASLRDGRAGPGCRKKSGKPKRRSKRRLHRTSASQTKDVSTPQRQTSGRPREQARPQGVTRRQAAASGGGGSVEIASGGGRLSEEDASRAGNEGADNWKQRLIEERPGLDESWGLNGGAGPGGARWTAPAASGEPWEAMAAKRVEEEARRNAQEKPPKPGNGAADDEDAAQSEYPTREKVPEDGHQAYQHAHESEGFFFLIWAFFLHLRLLGLLRYLTLPLFRGNEVVDWVVVDVDDLPRYLGAFGIQAQRYDFQAGGVEGKLLRWLRGGAETWASGSNARAKYEELNQNRSGKDQIDFLTILYWAAREMRSMATFQAWCRVLAASTYGEGSPTCTSVDRAADHDHTTFPLVWFAVLVSYLYETGKLKLHPFLTFGTPTSDEDKMELNGVRHVEEALGRQLVALLGSGHKLDIFLLYALVRLQVKTATAAKVAEGQHGELNWPVDGWTKSAYSAGDPARTDKDDQTRQFEGVAVMLPGRSWAEENPGTVKKNLKHMSKLGRRRWSQLVTQRRLRTMVLIPLPTLLRLKNIGFHRKGEYVPRTHTTLTIVTGRIGHREKVDVGGGGGGLVENGGTMLLLEEGGTLEADIKELLNGYECVNLEELPHSVQRVMERAKEFAKVPFNRPPEMQAWLEAMTSAFSSFRPWQGARPGYRGLDAQRIQAGGPHYIVTASWDASFVLMKTRKLNYEKNLQWALNKSSIFRGVSKDNGRRQVDGFRVDVQKPGGGQWPLHNIVDQFVGAMIRDRAWHANRKTTGGLNCLPFGWGPEHLERVPYNRRWIVCVEMGGVEWAWKRAVEARVTRLTLAEAHAIARAPLRVVIERRHLLGGEDRPDAATVLRNRVIEPLREVVLSWHADREDLTSWPSALGSSAGGAANAGQAEERAADANAGQTCPVCGAAEHGDEACPGLNANEGARVPDAEGDEWPVAVRGRGRGRGRPRRGRTQSRRGREQGHDLDRGCPLCGEGNHSAQYCPSRPQEGQRRSLRSRR